MLICWDFTMQAGFTENILEKIKSPVNSRFLSKKCLIGVKGQGRMATLLPGYRKERVTQISSCYNQAMQNKLMLKVHGLHEQKNAPR